MSEHQVPPGVESWELDELLNLIRGLVQENAHLRRQRDEARRIGRLAWEHAPLEWRRSLGDVSEWPWLQDEA